MKKTILIILGLTIGSLTMAQNSENLQNKNFHDFTVETIDGGSYDLSELSGKKVLVVNTASKCGFTPQYEDLQKIYEDYGPEKFVVIGFPANNFANQEPGSDTQIKQFCQQNYGVSFPMMSKISVKGDDQHPLYQWLTQKKYNGKLDTKVKWNFQKYLINEEGELVDVAYSKTKPTDEKIVSWITE